METKSILIKDKVIQVTLDDNGAVSAQISTGSAETEMSAEHLMEVVKTGIAPPPAVKLPGHILDLVTLSDWLVSKGFKRGSIEYDLLYGRLRENINLPLESHPGYKDLR